MTGSSDKLSALQRELCAGFFARERDFFLTGGAALAGFYLRHRETKDLDLFALPGTDLDRGERALLDAAHALGAETTKLQDFREFRRLAVRRHDELTIVDLVIDRAPQTGEKKAFDQVIVDSLEEIAANKLCTLLSRGEPRDLVDLMFLLRGGISLEAALEDAARKDGGANAATLAWILSEIHIGPEAVLPAGISGAELQTFRGDLEMRLRRLAFPAP